MSADPGSERWATTVATFAVIGWMPCSATGLSCGTQPVADNRGFRPLCQRG